MENFIKDAFGRMNLQQTISFILFGTDDFAKENLPYRKVLKTSSDPIYKRLESIYSDGIELDKASADLSIALSAYQNVYMELGMKAGARLLHELLLTDDRHPAELRLIQCKKPKNGDSNG